MKLFVTDLDGTLLDKGRQVRSSDKQALQEAAAMGIEICLASGRMDVELVKVMREVGGNYHRISQNGAFVTTKDNELLQTETFEPILAKQLIEIASPYDFATLIGINQTVYTPGETEAIQAIQQRMFTTFQVDPDIADKFERQTPCKLSFFGDITKLRALQAELAQKHGNSVETFISDKDCLDVMPAGVSKGRGLQALMNKLGITSDEVACIGDAFNDVSMFKVARHSFAMGHGPEEVRKAAVQVVDSVAEAIEELKKVRI
ncbi:HAD family hydrolase [Brevibacillus ginsengisoli]|uniref:HAD family hydrolase n=1 Tax=Brevibacillus ginsengisoli TaxID=363854 RepID=UPI003CF38B48